jgi:hypothetical protein
MVGKEAGSHHGEQPTGIVDKALATEAKVRGVTIPLELTALSAGIIFAPAIVPLVIPILAADGSIGFVSDSMAADRAEARNRLAKPDPKDPHNKMKIGGDMKPGQSVNLPKGKRNLAQAA